MIWGMSYYSLEEQAPEVLLEDAPAYVRQALMRVQRTSAALHVYRRRGWNPSAAQHAFQRAQGEFQDALDQWDHDHENPRLF